MNKIHSNEEMHTASVPATYQELEPVEPRSNPLIEVLPSIDSEIQIQDPLKYYHKVNSVIRMKPLNIRWHMAVNTADFFTPLPIHLSLQHRVDRMLGSGYHSRNPIASYWQHLNLELLIIDIE
jgi:hypothetical protein